MNGKQAKALRRATGFKPNAPRSYDTRDVKTAYDLQGEARVSRLTTLAPNSPRMVYKFEKRRYLAAA